LNNLKIFFFFVLSTNVVFAQIVPSFQGVYDKKSTSFSTSSSLIFDGSNDKVTTNLSMNNWSAFTFEAWVYPESTGSREEIIGHNDIIEFGFIDSNTIQLWTSRGSAINWDFSSSTLPFNT